MTFAPCAAERRKEARQHSALILAAEWLWYGEFVRLSAHNVERNGLMIRPLANWRRSSPMHEIASFKLK